MISDLLCSLAAFGVVISSGITLVVSVATKGITSFTLKLLCRYSSLGLLNVKLMNQKRQSAIDKLKSK